MKKLCLFLSVVMLLIIGGVTTAFADAASYDMEEAGFYVYVATPDGGLNMRHGPGTDYGKVMKGRIPDGVKLYIGYVSGNWGYTSYDGHDGWVALKQTSKNPPAPPATKKPQPTPEPTAAPTPVPPTPTVAVTEAPQESVAPVVSQTPEATQPVVTATPEHSEEEDAKVVKAAMTNQILLIAILVLFVIVIALLLVIIINLKSKKG